MMRNASRTAFAPFGLDTWSTGRALVFLLAIGAATASCRKVEDSSALAAMPATAPPSTAAESTSSSAAAPAGGKVFVKFHAPRKIEFSLRVSATGNLRPHQSAPLVFPVAGVLEQVRVKRGQWVPSGAILAVLDAAAARASLAQAEAGVAAAEAQLRLASDQYARLTAIRKDDGISAAQHFQAESQRDLAAAQVLAARAQRDQARVLLRHHTLKAPFEGVVIRVPEGVGFAVSPALPLFTLETTRSLVLESSVTQEEAADLRAGMGAFVTVPATGETTPAPTAKGPPSEARKAHVRVIVPSVDPATNRMPIEIDVPNPDDRFKPHAFARFELEGAPHSAWRIPPSALTQREGSFAAWTADADGHARAVRVRVLGEKDGWPVVVPSGAIWTARVRIVEAPPLGLTEGAELALGGATP